MSIYNFHLRLAPPTTPPPVIRRNNFGHWVDVPRFEQENFCVDQAAVAAGIAFTGPTQPGVPRVGATSTRGPTYTTSGNGNTVGQFETYALADHLDIDGSKGVIMRYRWRELETGTQTSNAVYTFARVAAELAQCQAIGDARGERFGFILFIEVRAFDNDQSGGVWVGVNPAPIYLQPFTTGSASATTWDMWRWHPTVKTRFALLVQALGAAFDSHPCWEGIAVSETSTVADTTAAGYTPEKFRDALIAESNAIAAAGTRGRHFFYHNFMSATNNNFPSGQNSRTYLNAVVDAGIANGAMVLCGPDILPNKPSLDSVYQRFADYNGQLPLMCAAQDDSHHWNSVAVNNSTPPFDSMTSIFNFGKNTLKLNSLAWTWKRGGTGNKFSNDAVPITNTPSWQPSPGWVAP